jgi:hypothetical protein
VYKPTPLPDEDMSLTLDVESEEMSAMSNLWDVHAEVEPPPPFNMGSIFRYDVPLVNRDSEREEMDQDGNGVDSSVSRSSVSEARLTSRPMMLEVHHLSRTTSGYIRFTVRSR